MDSLQKLSSNFDPLFLSPVQHTKHTLPDPGTLPPRPNPTYDWVAACGHIPCTRRPQTCHLWKLAQSLHDVQLGSDFNMWETLTQREKCPKELAIYGPGQDLWLLKFGP